MSFGSEIMVIRFNWLSFSNIYIFPLIVNTMMECGEKVQCQSEKSTVTHLQAAGARARKASLVIEKALKEFRKVSVEAGK